MEHSAALRQPLEGLRQEYGVRRIMPHERARAVACHPPQEPRALVVRMARLLQRLAHVVTAAEVHGDLVLAPLRRWAAARELRQRMGVGHLEGVVQQPLQLRRVLGNGGGAVSRASVVFRRPRIEADLRLAGHVLRPFQHRPVLGHLIELPALNERQRFIVEEVEARRIATTPPARCPGVVARPHRRQRRLGALQGIPYILRRRDVVVVPAAAAAAAAAYCCFGGVEGRQLFVIPILVHRSYQHGL